MISGPEKTQLKQLISSPQWGALERLANEICDKLRDESSVRETEWETVSSILTKEGEIRGIRRLLQEVFTHANVQN